MGLIRRAIAAGLSLVVGSGCAADLRPAPGAASPLRGIRTWAAYYASAPEAAPSLARFDLVVLDPGAHPPLEAVKRHGALVLMYVSLGEVNVHHRAYGAIRDSPWVLDANPNWPDARRLDVRAPGYERWLLDRVVPAALDGPVNGLFLDTADTALELERADPARFGGAGAALGRVLQALRARHPRALLVLNGGLPLAERLGALLDGVAVESIFTDYDFATATYRPRAAGEAAERLAMLKRLDGRGPALLALEYAPPEDIDWVDRLIALTRAQGLVPYVSTIGLDRVHSRTLARP